MPLFPLQNLLRAIDTGDAARVEAALVAAPELANERVPGEGDRDSTLLHRAIPSDGVSLTDNQRRIVRALAEAVVDIDACGWGANNGDCTPLTMAAWGGHAPIVRLLLACGANPNGSDGQIARRHRPIDTAAEHGHAAAVEALIEGGADFSLPHLAQVGLVERAARYLAENPEACQTHEPLLHFAKDVAMARLLIAAGADLAARDDVGRTPLLAAVEAGRHDVTALLIESGAEVDIFAAAGLGDSAAVDALLRADPGVSGAVQSDGATALFYAVGAGDMQSCALLLGAGARISPISRRFWACLTPLHLAIQRGHREVISLLLECGANLDTQAVENGYWPTPLHAAVRWGDGETVRQLLERGSDPNAGDCGWERPGSLGTSGLAFAIFTGNEEVLLLLLAHGLDIRHPNHRGTLHLTAEYGKAGVARQLLEAGADPEERDAHGETARASRAIRA